MAESIDIRELNERIERQSAFVTNLTTGMDLSLIHIYTIQSLYWLKNWNYGKLHCRKASNWPIYQNLE